MAQRPKWTNDDKASLQRLVDRYGVADVTDNLRAELEAGGEIPHVAVVTDAAGGKAKASGRGRGQPAANSGDMLGVWDAVEVLMRRDGLLKTAACDRIAEQAKRLFGPKVKGYGTSMLAKLHTDAENYFEKWPLARSARERDIAAWVEKNKDKPSVLPMPIRAAAYLDLVEQHHGKVESDFWRSYASIFRRKRGKKSPGE
jgi:hypothetical protein